MLGTRQRPGVRLVGVDSNDLKDMQAIVDGAHGKFDANKQVMNMLASAHSSSKRPVDLVEEGWHQLEELYGKKWLHITLFAGGVKYHCYTPVSGVGDRPKAGTHRIESISYVSFVSGKSTLVEVMRSNL